MIRTSDSAESTPSSASVSRSSRVSKACDRCRTNKSKCDGKRPCVRCKSKNGICTYYMRKPPVNKSYPKGYPDLLERQNEQLSKGLLKLYKLLQHSGDSEDRSPSEPPEPLLVHDVLENLGVLDLDTNKNHMFRDNDSEKPRDGREKPLPSRFGMKISNWNEQDSINEGELSESTPIQALPTDLSSHTHAYEMGASPNIDGATTPHSQQFVHSEALTASHTQQSIYSEYPTASIADDEINRLWSEMFGLDRTLVIGW
ncbi:hypothetical protein E4T42_09185 [Aureobasidium subglaciale]|nr:hypothetical protein E4T42_09185 [Aureobasidium subglaciale]